MIKPLAALALFAISTTCIGAEPPPPQPPQTSVIPAVPVQSRPALPTFDRSAGVSPATPTLAQPAPQIVTESPPTPWIGPVVPVDSGVWYRPEAVVPGTNAGLHARYPYYSYRRPWYPAGPASLNVTIVW